MTRLFESTLTRESQHEPDFSTRVDRLVAKYVSMWRDTDGRLPHLGDRHSDVQQRENQRRCDQLISDLDDAFRCYPEAEPRQRAWRRRLRVKLLRFTQECLGYSEPVQKILFSPDYVETTRRFVQRAKEFNQRISVDDLYQALRNVWIMNSIQMFLDLDITCSPSIFAYSMLYPYTDNYLDDRRIPVRSKRTFNRRLEQRLKGGLVEARTRRDRDLSRLVSLIERDLHRRGFPDVYASLLAIHRAQDKSLLQQSGGPPLCELDILRISVRKGGTSVLAHGYLVNGSVADDEADFFFGYGVFLQLLDDLQDVQRDQQCRHRTMFSQAAETEPLDRLTSRLYLFMERALDSTSRFADARYDGLKELIRRNCAFLMLAAVAHNHEFYSQGYLKRLEPFSPVRFSYLRGRRETVMKKYDELKHRLSRRRDFSSVFDVLG